MSYRVRLIPQIEDDNGCTVATNVKMLANSWAVLLQHTETEEIIDDYDFSSEEEAAEFADRLCTMFNAEADYD